MAMHTLWTVAPVSRVLGRSGAASASTSARGGEDLAKRDGTVDEAPSAGEAGAPRVGRMDAWRELGFGSAREMREHHGSDFLRHNRRRVRGGRAPLTEAEFEAVVARTHGGSDLSSISGSDDSDEEDDSDDEANGGVTRLAVPASRDEAVSFRAFRASRVGANEGARLAVETEDGTTFGVWRCLVASPGRDVDARLARDALRALQTNATRGGACWVVVLARGGHFAASAFDPKAFAVGPSGRMGPPRAGDDGGARLAAAELVPSSAAIAHKTFHRYVVRAKAGGRQSGKDGGGKTIKSAGSSVRRANEAALEKEIRALLGSDAWRGTLERAALLFVSASKTDERTLFVGADAPLRKDDARVRRVPFATRRPTFNETRRVVGKLALVTRDVDAVDGVETTEDASPTETRVDARLAAAKARAAEAVAALDGLGVDGEDGAPSAPPAAPDAPSLSKKEKEKLKKRRAKERARAERERAASSATATRETSGSATLAADDGSRSPSEPARVSVGGGTGGKAAALLAKARQSQNAKRDEAVRDLDGAVSGVILLGFFLRRRPRACVPVALRPRRARRSRLTVARVYRTGARRRETSGVSRRSAETHRRGRGIDSFRGFRIRRRFHRGGVRVKRSRPFSRRYKPRGRSWTPRGASRSSSPPPPSRRALGAARAGRSARKRNARFAGRRREVEEGKKNTRKKKSGCVTVYTSCTTRDAVFASRVSRAKTLSAGALWSPRCRAARPRRPRLRPRRGPPPRPPRRRRRRAPSRAAPRKPPRNPPRDPPRAPRVRAP